MTQTPRSATSTAIRITGWIAAAALLLAGWTAPWFVISTASAQTACSIDHAGMDGAESAVLSLINAERARSGLGALSVSGALNAAAAWKSQDQAGTSSFSHTDSLGRSPSARAKACGYGGDAGENIAEGHASAEDVFAAWMSSSGHRANILNASYGVIGIGRFEGPRGMEWTTTFGFGGAPAPVAPPAAAPAPAPQPAAVVTDTRAEAATAQVESTAVEPAAPGLVAMQIPMTIGEALFAGEPPPGPPASAPVGADHAHGTLKAQTNVSTIARAAAAASHWFGD